MTSSARDIGAQVNSLSRQVSNTLSFSTSPNATFHSPPLSYSGVGLNRSSTAQGVSAKQLKPFATEDIKILLLENINQIGRENLERQGYQVEFHKSSLPEQELIAKIRYGVE